MATRAVVFDLFGTLIAPWPLAANDELAARFSTESGVAFEAFKAAWSADRPLRETGPLQASIARVCAGLGIASPGLEARMLDHRREWTRTAVGSVKPAALETLAAIRGRGLATALLSDCSSDVADVWKGLPLAPHFDATLFSAQEGTKKPDPRLYLRACARLGIAPHECLFVGDGGSDELPGATAVGMRAVQIRHADAAHPAWDGPTVATLAEVFAHL
jgi:putative hydrolase of the HAD superfamily